MLEVIAPGVQTTLQGSPRTGLRHMGMPWSGPADNWSMALANRLVGNVSTATVMEITYGGFEVRFERSAWYSLAGAAADAELSGEVVPFHQTLFAPVGAVLKLSAPSHGMRTYLATAGGFEANDILGSTSTYLPAELGGYEGRSLRGGDKISLSPQPEALDTIATPPKLRPAMSNAYTLRACVSAETQRLSPESQSSLFGTAFKVGRQATRMGVSLEGRHLSLKSDGKMKSAAVFPGIIQCPEDGRPIILLADAQTTGGYPRIASIARCDRHVLGQIRPGDTVRWRKRTHAEAVQDLRSKLALLRSWVPDFSA